MGTGSNRARNRLTRVIAGVLATAALCAAAVAEEQSRHFEIKAKPLAEALMELGSQAGTVIVAPTALTAGKTAAPVSGSMSLSQALLHVLTGSGLKFSEGADGTIVIVRADAVGRSAERINATRLAQADSSRADSGGDDDTEGHQELREVEVTAGIPEVLVVGSKVLNTDIRRTRDDPQPYVVFDRGRIEESGAVDLEDFLKRRVTMNTVGPTGDQFSSFRGNTSQVNLRGLGTDETLILIDGHRAAGFASTGAPQQPDINGIPLAAIERIEILPTTASGIYGGAATGGVVNIILRRDYSGAEVKVNYNNTFQSNSAQRRVDFSSGFNLEAGKTNVLLAASWSDDKGVLTGDRSLFFEGRLTQLANNPASILPPVAPPLGYTTNIRSASGDLTLDNGTPLNSSFTFVPVGYAGFASAGDGGAAFLANAGQYNLNLADSAQASGGRKLALVNGPTVKSLMTTVRREFSDRVQAFLEIAASNNVSHFTSSQLASTFTLAGDAPNNPFQEQIQVTVPSAAADSEFRASNDDRRLVGGVIVKLPRNWQAEVDYTWNRTRHEYLRPSGLSTAGIVAVQSGALDVLRDTNAFPLDLTPFLTVREWATPSRFTIKDATLRASGPIYELPSGPIVVSSLIEHRDESIDESFTHRPPTLDTYSPPVSQSVDSVYLEARIPLVSSKTKLFGIQELELQVAARRDDYTIEGANQAILAFNGAPLPFDTIERRRNETSSTDPTVGLRYRPFQDLTLRASYGTGFLPPSVIQLAPAMLNDATAAIIGAVNDPRRGGETFSPTAAQLEVGGNANLKPESSESWSVGAIFTARFMPGLRLSVDYTKIDKVDNIGDYPGGAQGIVNDEALFPSRVRRGPNRPGDPADWAGPIIFVDATSMNLLSSQVEAYDVQLDYSRETARFGTFEFFALSTWQPHYRVQPAANQPLLEQVGFTALNPLRFKANAGVTWRRRGWTLGWNSHYFDSYKPYAANATAEEIAGAIADQGAGEVPDQVYHDVFGGYRFGLAGGEGRQSHLFDGVEIQAGINNVFDTEPPFVTGREGRALYSPYGDPRQSNYYISVRKAF